MVARSGRERRKYNALAIVQGSVNAALLGSALVTAAAEFDNARTANAATSNAAKDKFERIIIAGNFAPERLESPSLAPPPSIRD